MSYKKQISFLCSLCVVTAILFNTSSIKAEDKVPGILRLPPRVYAMMTIPNVSDMKERSSKTPMVKLWNDPEFEEFKNQIMSQVMEYSEQINQHIGIGLKEILNIPHGEITIAYVQDSEGQLGGVSLMDFGDQEDNVYTLLNALKLGMDALNAEQSSLEIEGTEVTDFSIPLGQGDEEEEEEEDNSNKENKHLYYFIKGTFLCMANKESGIKDLLARWDGKHEETFANNETYKYIQQRAAIKDETPTISWYVDPIGLVKKLTLKYGRGNLQAQMMLGFLPNLGLNNLKAIGGSAFEMTDQFETVHRTLICVDQPLTGIPAIFRCHTTHQVPPKWVPKDVASYASMNWNVGAAYDSIEAMVDSIQGKGFFSLMINKLENDENGPKIHIKKDLIDQMTGEMQVVTLIDNEVVDNADEEEALLSGNMGDRVLFTLGLKDGKAVEDLIKNIIKTKGFPGEVREFLGSSIYEMKDENSGTHSGFTLHQDQLIMTSHIPLLESVLRTGDSDDSLVNSEEYKAISAHFPRETAIIHYQKQEKQMEVLYKMAKSGVFSQFLPEFDFSVLPDFELIKKYLSNGGSYAVPDERGALLVSFTLAKE